jgi:hypothetical protein
MLGEQITDSLMSFRVSKDSDSELMTINKNLKRFLRLEGLSQSLRDLEYSQCKDNISAAVRNKYRELTDLIRQKVSALNLQGIWLLLEQDKKFKRVLLQDIPTQEFEFY